MMKWRGIILFVVVVAGTCLLATTASFAQETATAPEGAGVQVDGEYGAWLPTNIARHDYARQVDQLINVLHVFMAILFVGWGIFFVYCLVRFRQRSGHRASNQLPKAKVSKYSEVAVAIFEAALLIGISIPVWASVKNDLPGEDDDPLRVRVIAEQFQFNFHYPGADGVFGRTAPKFIDLATNPVGLDKSDTNGEDDIVSATFHVPKDRPVIVEIGSKDVIHSFFVPVLRVKQDAIPGMRIPVWFVAGETGTYEVACAQLCGNNHYSMRAFMVVQEQGDFEAWVEKQSAPPEFLDDF
jgi:cytochrome c oxidase subunit II